MAQTNTIYVGNLSWDTDSDTLHDLFKSANLSVTNAEVQYYGNGTRSKGWGLVTFSKSGDVDVAIEKFNESDVDGRKVVVRADRGTTVRSNKFDDAKQDDDEGEVSSNRIFVGNLTWDTTSDDLRNAFSKYGAVSDAEVMTRNDGKSRGWGIVQMDNQDEANEAVDSMDGFAMDGRNIRVEFQKSKPAGARRTRNTRKPRRARDSKLDQDAAPSSSIFVGNLPWSYTNEDLNDMFSKFRPTNADVKIGYDGRSRGYGIVNFSSVDDASAAIDDVNGLDCGGRNVIVRFNTE